MIDSRGVSVALSEEPRRRHVMDQTESGDAPGDVSAAVEPKAEWGGVEQQCQVDVIGRPTVGAIPTQ